MSLLNTGKILKWSLICKISS